MRHLIDASRALFTTMRQVLRTPVTVQFPTEIRKRPERYRTSFALLHDEHGEELCIGCLQCERICPSTVITVTQGPKSESKVTGKKRGWASDFVLDTTACISCELCVQVCPTDALIMTQVADIPAYSREELVLTMDKLYAHEKDKPASWGTGTRLMGMQEAPKEEKKPKPAKPVAAAAPAAAEAAPAAALAAAEPTSAPVVVAPVAAAEPASAPVVAAALAAPPVAETSAVAPAAPAPATKEESK